MPTPINIVLYYAPSKKDKQLREELEKYLNILKGGDSQITIWHAASILAGEFVSDEIVRHLEEAHIILLLVTPDLLAPGNINSHEMQVILRRLNSKEVYVVPILLRITPEWEKRWFGELKALPFDEDEQENKRSKPISQWSNRERAFANIVDGISRVITSIQDTYSQRWSYRWLIREPGPVPTDIIRPESVVYHLYSQLMRLDTTGLVLTGSAGAGKSTLAHLVYEHAEDLRQAGNSPFTAKALWLTIDATTTMNDTAGTLFEALHRPLPYIPHVQFSIQPRELATALFNALNDVDQPRLIVLDQCEHLIDNDPGMADWVQLLSERPCLCRLLFTAHKWLAYQHDGSPVYIGEYPIYGLEPAEGIALLQSRHIAASPQSLETIVQRWHGHPNALASLAELLTQESKSLDDFLTEDWSSGKADKLSSFLNYLYFHQLDQIQRSLLFAFVIFREPVSLYAAQFLISEDQAGLAVQFPLALNKLLVLLLLEAKQEDRYQPHALIADYVRTDVIKGDERSFREAVRHAHNRAATYYQQRFALIAPPQGMQRRISDVHDLIEAVWHLCQAEQWNQAYELMVREHLFVDLQRWGGSVTLLELYQLFFPLERWQPTPSQAAHIRAELGGIYHHLGQKEEARNELEQALNLFQSIDELPGMVFTLNTLGEVYRVLDMPARAIACYDRALSLCEQIHGDEAIQLKGIALNNLGSAYHELKQWEQARRYYEEALTYHLDVSEAAITRNNLGQLYEMLKRPEEALQSYKQALRSFQEVGDHRGEAAAFMNLGSFWRKRGEPEQAFTCYRQSVRLFQEIGDRWGEVRVLRNLAHWYRLSKNYRYALAFLYRAGDLLEELHSPRKQEIEELIALLRHEPGQDAFELLATEVRPQAALIVEEALRRDMQH